MERMLEKYRSEIDFLRSNYGGAITENEYALALNIDCAVKTIQNYTGKEYNRDEHFAAMIELVVNRNRVDKDGLTNAVRGMLGHRSIRVF